MKVSEVGLLDQVFTHINDVTGAQTDWAADAMNRALEAMGAEADKWKCKIPVEQHHAEYCIANRGPEEYRIQRLMRSPADLTRPILFVELPETNGPDSHLLVDGTHRYIIFYSVGAEWIPAFIVPYDWAKQFIIEDAPKVDNDKLMTSWSGVL
jgi:hypothetical protein